MIVISEEIGGTVEQHYNRPGLEFGVALLNNTTAGHGVRNVHSINVIKIEPILLWGSVCISLLRVGRSRQWGNKIPILTVRHKHGLPCLNQTCPLNKEISMVL